MRKRLNVAFAAPVLLAAIPVWAQAPDTGPGSSEPVTVEVRMVDKGPTEFVFEPAEITVRPGDRVVWIQTGVMPHNVEFTEAPEGGFLDELPMSPFLTAKGQRYELVIDDRFQIGEYGYICTPHVAMGMSGVIRVVEGEQGTNSTGG